MTTNNHIAIIIVGYKDKNLAALAKQIKANTVGKCSIEVFDQHAINHSKDFDDMEYCSYESKIWDDIAGPLIKKTEKIHNRLENADYICIASPDVLLSPGWDQELVLMLEDKDVVFSGSGIPNVYQKDRFSIGVDYLDSEDFNVAQIVDRNFIFAKTSSFADIRMPDFLKYAGENEYFSVSFLSRGLDIVSVPRRMYLDSKTRSVENTYHTFSLEHNYNMVIDILNKKDLADYRLTQEGVDKFLSYHNIDISAIHKLPYATNDVDYNPYNLEMHEVDARRFVSGVKAVY